MIVILDVPALGRVAVVGDNDEANLASCRETPRGKVWTPAELDLLKGWPQAEARKVADIKEQFNGHLLPSQHAREEIGASEALLPNAKPHLDSARGKRYRERGHGIGAHGSAYRVARPWPQVS